MQTKNIELEKKILNVAKSEFLKYGYHKTSFRKIAEILNISHGNIMTYFKNKKDLFDKIVEPALDFMRHSLVENIDYNKITDSQLISYLDFESTKSHNIKLFKDIDKNRELLILLLFNSYTYDYRNIRKDTEKLFCATIDLYIKELIKRKLIKNSQISLTFKRTIASLYINIIEKIILHNMDEHEIENYALEMTSLISYGVGKIVGRTL